MADITAWSATAASNVTVNSVGIATGMNPGNVDDALREIMAGVKATLSDTSKYTFYTGASGLAIASGGTGASTAAGARTALGLGTISTLDETSAAQYRANITGKALSVDKAWSAADYVALTPGASVPIDMSAGINFTLAMGGNYTLANPGNPKNGQTGTIVITQDGTGSRTLAYGANWDFAGGTAPTLSTAASARDLLFYQVISASSIYATLVKGIA